MPRRIANARLVKTGCGDASACLRLRTPLTRRDCWPPHQKLCLCFSEDFSRAGASCVLRRGRR